MAFEIVEDTSGTNDIFCDYFNEPWLGYTSVEDWADDYPWDWYEEVDIYIDYYDVYYGGYDLETIVLHELGHFLGLGHSEYYYAIMYGSWKGVQHSLYWDDEDGAQYIY